MGWLVHSWSTFGLWTSHEQTWTHKTHHNLDLGETTTFFLIIFFVFDHGPAPKCHFVLGLPSGNPKMPKIWTLVTLETHNFVCKPPIKVNSKAKLYPLLKAFQ
jgi:hypothetical protein